MPSLLDGIARFPRYNPKEPLTEDQRTFINMVGGPGKPNRVCWSDRIAEGKSVAMAILVLKWALKYPGCTIWYGRKHYKHFLKNNWQTFLRVVPQDIWKYKVYGGHNPTDVVFPNGSKVMLVGFNDASSNLGGEPVAIFWEEISEADMEVWNYCEGRLGRTGFPDEAFIMVGVGNPRGHYPLWRKFCNHEGVDEVDQKNYVWYKSKNQFSMRSRLKPRYYEQLFSSYPKELQERFLKGSDDTNAGQIYPFFNKEIHIHSFNWNPDWIPFCGVDYGRVDPTAAVFLGLDPRTGDVYQIGEYYQANIPTVDIHARQMDEIVAEIGWPKSDDAVGKVIDNNTTDPGGGNKSILQMFADNGWYFMPSGGKKNSLMPGIEKITQLLMPRANGLPPKFHIHPRCHHTIEEFSLYEWSVPATASDMITFREKPREDYNHSMDALRYAISIMPNIESPTAVREIGGPYSQLGFDRDDEDEDTESPKLINQGLVCDPENIRRLNAARKAGGWAYVKF